MFELFSKRNRQGQKTDVFTYDTLPQPLKVQIIHVWNGVIINFPSVYFKGADVVYVGIAQAICKERGVFRLTRNAGTAEEDVCNYFLQEQNVDYCLDVIEIVFDYFVQLIRNDSHTLYGCMDYVRQAVVELNARFKEHSVGYEFQNGKIIRIDSEFIHNEAVSPAMTLLHDSDFIGANQEFLKAHEHFRHGRFPEAINECLKSFESTMKAICHKRDWQYNQTDTAKTLLSICEKNGLFPSFMQSSLAGLRSVLENVATVRNKLSGHGQGVQQVQITEEVAAFVIHSTAANILFLASLEKNAK
ncbi:MAG: hypothetical protein ABSD57_08225 [Verrucomicrobiota bacterium]|jgi:hypothetical protein